MSVGFEERVDIRPYAGYTDPGLPIAAWVGQAGRAGDATGGIITMDFNFQDDDTPLISEFFSLDQCAIDLSVGTNQEGSIQTKNMDNLALNRPLSDQLWRFDLLGFNSQASLSFDERLILPLWLGSPNRIEGSSGLRFNFTNVDLRLYQIIVQGYVWGPRSMLAEGGPRRPIGGLFP